MCVFSTFCSLVDLQNNIQANDIENYEIKTFKREDKCPFCAFQDFLFAPPPNFQKTILRMIAYLIY